MFVCVCMCVSLSVCGMKSAQRVSSAPLVPLSGCLSDFSTNTHTYPSTRRCMPPIQCVSLVACLYQTNNNATLVVVAVASVVAGAPLSQTVATRCQVFI